jgi:O-antigen/teichoic acid export membrane protein
MSRNRRILIEAAIAGISTAGLLAIILLLLIFPTALGRNVSTAGALFPLMIAIPALRNIVEYHADLLYAAEMTGRRLIQLGLVAVVKLGLMSALLILVQPIEIWSLWLNAVFAVLYAISLALVLKWLPIQRRGAFPAIAGSSQPMSP